MRSDFAAPGPKGATASPISSRETESPRSEPAAETHWAPDSHGEYYWIVFSSERDYGHRVTRANTAPSCIANGVQQCKQIWVGAISKAALAAGAVDPSAAPMWLPGQDTQTTNISPFWTAGLIVN